MKITKDYLRKLIREGLEEVSGVEEGSGRKWSDPSVLKAKEALFQALDNYEKILQSKGMTIDPRLDHAFNLVRNATAGK